MMKEKTILLIEDNPDDVELTLRALKKNEIANRVDVINEGDNALDYLLHRGSYSEETHSNPALILLDLKIPKVDGINVLRQIRSNEETQLIPVVILTSSKEEKDLIDSYKLGANSYICKPVNMPQFVEAMGHLGLYWLVLNEPPPDLRGGS
ncbi:MAG: response regulator [Halobacteriota archaeon]|nr:response regulator [Halobacteriota archaeon]